MMEGLKKTKDVNQRKPQAAVIFPVLKSASEMWMELSGSHSAVWINHSRMFKKIKIRGRFNAWILFPLCMQIMQCKRYNLDMVYLLSIFSLNVLLYVGYTISVISNKMSVM